MPGKDDGGKVWRRRFAAGALVPMIVLLPIIVSRGLTGLAYALPPPCCSRRAACLAAGELPTKKDLTARSKAKDVKGGAYTFRCEGSAK